MHAGVSAWAVLHLPRYIHQRALKVPDMHLAKQHVKVYCKKSSGYKVHSRQKGDLWGCTQAKRGDLRVGVHRYSCPISSFPNFPLFPKR